MCLGYYFLSKNYYFLFLLQSIQKPSKRVKLFNLCILPYPWVIKDRQLNFVCKHATNLSGTIGKIFSYKYDELFSFFLRLDRESKQRNP